MVCINKNYVYINKNYNNNLQQQQITNEILYTFIQHAVNTYTNSIHETNVCNIYLNLMQLQLEFESIVSEQLEKSEIHYNKQYINNYINSMQTYVQCIIYTVKQYIQNANNCVIPDSITLKTKHKKGKKQQ